MDTNANNHQEASGSGVSPEGFPYPPEGAFKPGTYSQEVKAAIMNAGKPKEGNTELAAILKKEYGYLIDEDGYIQGRSQDQTNPETGVKYPFLTYNNQRVTMPLNERLLKEHAHMPKWTGYFKDMDDFCIRMLRYWNWMRHQKIKEKKKEKAKSIRDQKLNAPNANNNENRDFVRFSSLSAEANMASGSAQNGQGSSTKVSNPNNIGGILASKKIPDLIDLPKVTFPSKYPEGQEGDELELACENLSREYRHCESLVALTKSLTNEELIKFWRDLLITNESLSLKDYEQEAESLRDRYSPDQRGWEHINKKNTSRQTPSNKKPDEAQPIMHASGSIKRTATSDKPGKGSFVPKNREIPKDLSGEQAKPVLHIRPKKESAAKVFSESDWKNICSTLFSAMMLRDDAHQYGDVMINGPKLDKKGQGFILCKDQNGLNWLLNLAKESLKSADCYQGNYAPRANLRVKFLGMHEGDPVTLLKTSLKMSGISCRYPDEIKISKVTPISASGRVVDFNLNKKDMEEIGSYRELQKKNTLLLFTQIPFHILLPDGKEDNWEPKGNNTAQALSAKSQEKETPIIDLVNEKNAEDLESLKILGHSEIEDDDEEMDEEEIQRELESDSDAGMGNEASEVHPAKKPKQTTNNDENRWADDIPKNDYASMVDFDPSDPLRLNNLSGNRYVYPNHLTNNKTKVTPKKQANNLHVFTAKKRRRKKATQEKEICLLSFSRMAPKLPDQPGTGSNQDENASMMFSEREFNENMSVRSKISIEFSTDLNGQGNSQKTSLNITSNTTESKDSDAIDNNECTKNNSQKTSSNIVESKDYNVIDDKNYQPNQFPRLAPNSGIETKSPSREPVTNSEHKLGTNQDESTSMTFSEREFNENKSSRPKIPTEPPKDQNGPGNSQKTSIDITSNTMESKDSDVTDNTKCTKNNSQKTSSNIVESKDYNVIDDKNNQLNQFPRLAPNPGTETRAPSREPVTNSEPKFGTNQDESTSMTFSEREFNENKSSRPKIPTEPPKDQNGPGNSQKTSLNISSNATKSQDSNVMDKNIYTKNNEKSPRSTTNSGNDNETPQIRKSARIGRGQKGCNKTCAGCSSHEHKTPSNNTLKKDRKPSRRPSERYVKHSFLKILNSVIQSPKTDNISVSYGSDNKVQIKRKFEMSVEPAKNEASNEASKVDPDNDKKTSSTFKDKSPGQSKKLSNKSKKIKQNPKTP